MTGRSQAAEHGPPSKKGLLRSRLRDARIRSKLGLILIIPLIAVVGLAGLRLVDSGQRALTAELVRSLTAVSAEAATVTQALHTERMAAVQLLADPDGEAGGFNVQAVETDEAVEAYRATRAEVDSAPELVEERLVRVDEQLGTLGGIREGVLAGSGLGTAVLQYGGIVRDVVSYQESIAQVAVDPELAESIRAVAALSKAKAEMSESAVEAFVALREEEIGDEQLTPFLATLTGRQEALLTFSRTASPEQQALVNEYYTGGVATLAERAENDVLRATGGEAAISAADAANALGAIADNVRFAEQRLHTDQVQFATGLRDDVYQQVLIEFVAVLLALIVAVAVAVLLARMLARSLGQLRENALTVAERELPETVERLSDPRTLGENTPAQLAAQVREPIQLRSRDEIGEVAQAFNVVHRAAIRVAAEQAALRTSVSAMFLSLARRSQSLVDRMISQLDEIERNEEDPKRLARMFALDHLATRMRRNDENLLVLAGADSSPPRSDDALVTDALRAAQSEVEHYDRIEFGTVDSDVSVVALAVNDVVRLVAELFDNATRFSPPDSAVVCEARRLGDHVIIQIEDRGVGMSQDQVSRLNAWLATPPALEVTTFRKMGLAVVARLASRHQIRVELRCDPNYGTIAYVALPRAILVLPRSRTRSLEMPVPRSPLPVEQAPSAAPPMPARHVGQLPKRSPGVAHHSASGRNSTERGDDRPATENGWSTQQYPQVNNDSTQQHRQVHNDQSRHDRNAGTNQFDLPVAGRSLYDLTSSHDTAAQSPPPANAAPASAPPPNAAQPPPEATVELPIFKEMEQVWFRGQDTPRAGHGSWDSHSGHGSEPQPGGGYQQQPSPPPNPNPTAATPPTQPTHAAQYGGQPAGHYEPGARHEQPAAPQQEPDNWRTAADFGWRAAAAAAQPTSGGATASGLPKRVPQAQLVPGSVDTPSAPSSTSNDASTATSRRSPEEIRGLLSAYHRGVQRGRESGAR